MIQICSLGGGVASTALFLMSLHGEIENPADAAVFADTGWERQSTYNTINFLSDYAKQFDVPVHIISGGNVRDNALNPDTIYGQMPFYSYNQKGKPNKIGQFCTKEFKVYPILRFIRKHYNASAKNPVVGWLGYSVDEATRMRPSKVKYQVLRYPLIERRVYRHECQQWLNKHGFDFVDRSACIGCPHRRDNEYRDMPENEIQAAINFENEVNKQGYRMYKDGEVIEVRLHRSMTPLSERPFDTNQNQPDLFDDVCDGDSCFT